ncbi:MAG TPA: hypothetical protein VFI95_01345, partial [Terriglobales bacterium]|nr:hypothetical protein [Terriglobales bacterium]
YRVTTNALAEVDYIGPVYESIAGNPGVPLPPIDTTVWDASKLQMYDDSNVPANLLSNAEAKVTTSSTC